MSREESLLISQSFLSCVFETLTTWPLCGIRVVTVPISFRDVQEPIPCFHGGLDDLQCEGVPVSFPYYFWTIVCTCTYHFFLVQWIEITNKHQQARIGLHDIGHVHSVDCPGFPFQRWMASLALLTCHCGGSTIIFVSILEFISPRQASSKAKQLKQPSQHEN